MAVCLSYFSHMFATSCLECAKRDLRVRGTDQSNVGSIAPSVQSLVEVVGVTEAARQDDGLETISYCSGVLQEERYLDLWRACQHIDGVELRLQHCNDVGYDGIKHLLQVR